MIWIPFVAVPTAVALIQLDSMHTMGTFMTLAALLAGVVIVVQALAVIKMACVAHRRR